MYYSYLTEVATPMTVTQILEGVSGMVTKVFSMVGQVGELLVNTPVLFIGFGICFVGTAIGIFKSLARK